MNLNVTRCRKIGLRTIVAAALLTIALSGCGGGDDPPPAATVTETVTVDSNPVANLPEPTLDEGDRRYLRDLDAHASDLEAALPTLDAGVIDGVRDEIAATVSAADEDVYGLGDKLLSAATIAAGSFESDDPTSLLEAAPRLREVQGTIAAQLATP